MICQEGLTQKEFFFSPGCTRGPHAKSLAFHFHAEPPPAVPCVHRLVWRVREPCVSLDWKCGILGHGSNPSVGRGGVRSSHSTNRMALRAFFLPLLVRRGFHSADPHPLSCMMSSWERRHH